jgi:hypothetical protein
LFDNPKKNNDDEPVSPSLFSDATAREITWGRERKAVVRVEC